MPTFRCPSCREPLAEIGAGVRCVNGHTFDRAREGYVNLLPAGRLRGQPAGDDDTMVRARRRVFDAGLYDPVINGVADAVASDLGGSPAAGVLDIGCGEGSYGQAIATRRDAQVWGVDISKPAVKLAARRSGALRYAVASAYALPFADGEFAAVLNVFSPRDFDEMNRVLAPGGAAFVVTPGPAHLAEITRLLYDDPRQHSADDGDDHPAERESMISFEIELADEAMRVSLLQMTPYWWAATETRRDAVAARINTITVDMRLRLHRRPA